MSFSFDVTGRTMPEIVAVDRISSSHIRVHLTGDSRLRQTLESTDDLSGGVWSELATCSGVGIHTEDVTGVGQRFYRVRQARQSAAPSGNWLGSSPCGGWHEEASLGARQECLQFAYDGEARLSLTHKCACFNCCLKPSGVVDIDMENRTVRIREQESEGSPCSCLCLYDIDYSVFGLDPGFYTAQVEAWDSGSWRLVMETRLDLSTPLNDAYCEPRSGYPWE